jgi:cellulose synthase/poly-beta-1,6-N-acetylglucosamine synthase-like glycosyltransferase
MGKETGMGRKILNAYNWLEAHPGWVFTTGLVVVGAVNLYRWGKDKQAAARLAGAGDDHMPAFEHTPRVSFLVPAWNEAQHIQACLGSILALRYPEKELVVCAGGEDGSYTLAKRFEGPEVIVLKQQPGEGKQCALRRCFANSTGEIIFLTDADCLVAG